MIHLDTNFVIACADSASEPHRKAAAWVSADDELAVSAVAWGEFQCGPPGGLPSDDDLKARRFITAIVPLTEAQSELAARLFNATGGVLAR